MIGIFDDIPAERFGALKPLPEGWAVIWNEGNEMYYATKRGTDMELGPTWNRYWCRRWAFEYDKEKPPTQ